MCLSGSLETQASFSTQCNSGCLQNGKCVTVQECDMGTYGSLCSTDQMCQDGCCFNHLCSPFDIYCSQSEQKAQIGSMCENSLSCDSKCCYQGLCQMSQFCGLTPPGGICSSNSNCDSGYCNNGQCYAFFTKLESGAICFEDNQCFSGCCSQGVCQETIDACQSLASINSSCNSNTWCQSGCCINQKCVEASVCSGNHLNAVCLSDTDCQVGLCCGTDNTCTQLFNCPYHLGAPCTESCCCIDDICQPD